MRKYFPFFLILFLFTGKWIQAQDSLAIGEWNSYLPYTTGYYLSESEDKIIYSTRWSLFTIDKNDLSIELFDKINMLTDIGISKHQYDNTTKQLIVVYDDSNIDIIRGTEVINIPDIRNNSSIIGDKQIYNVRSNGDGTILLSCGFGVVEFDLTDYEFGFTCFTDVPVYNVTNFGQYIIAATEDGLYGYDKSTYNNPSDFSLWKHLGFSNHLPEVYLARDVIEWKEQLYLATPDQLYKAGDDLAFELIHQTSEDSEIQFLNAAENDLLVGVNWVYAIGKVLFFDESDEFVQGHHECATKINYAVMDEEGRIWYADQKGGISYALNRIYSCHSIEINSPYSNNVTDVETKDDQLYIASGGVDESYTYIYRRDGFFVWNGEKWINYNEHTNDKIKEESLYDFFRILPHPSQDKVYVGTYQTGLVELDVPSQELTIYDQNNSTLRGKTGDPSRERISGLAFDDEENLWISNFGAPQPLSVLTPDGEWISLNVNSGKDLRDIAIDPFGNKWIVIDREAEGFLIFNEGEDLNNALDDDQRVVSKSNSNLESNKVNDIEVDLNGDVWIGTADGPVVFECGAQVFENSCTGNRRTTSLDGFGAYVLDDVNIRCIETDGANRKWLGTDNGIFVLSPSGTEDIYHFTTQNSPLFDNSIIDLAYNGKNGTMYIATAMGVMSFRTKTSGSTDKHHSDIYAYPNPVRPEYYGPIAIKGFARDSNIKITDINGQLVHESTSYGGQAIWDGYDYNGRRAASGVYLVYASTTDSFEEPEAVVTKILFINGD